MSKHPKLHFNNSVLFVTASIEEGILLPSNLIVELIFYSALARAQYLHPVRLCHFLVEGSHVHLLLVVDDPQDVKGFMERFKTESAHYINKLLGKRKRTVWCEDYDSQPILTYDDVIDYIKYIYQNPTRDGLIDSISEYPGPNSWDMYQNGNYTRECPRVHRPMISQIPTGPLPRSKYKAISNVIKKKTSESHTLTIEPDAWLECFEMDEPEERKAAKKRITEEILEAEKGYREERSKAGKRVRGAGRLRVENFDLSYIPDRKGTKKWCICSDIKLRIAFIEMVKQLIAEAREVYERWKVQDYSVPYPLGLYPPSMPKVAEPTGLAALL